MRNNSSFLWMASLGFVGWFQQYVGLVLCLFGYAHAVNTVFFVVVSIDI